VALSTTAKIAIAVGVTAAVVTTGAVVLAKSSKSNVIPSKQKTLNFDTRNADALNAVVNAMINDPKLTSTVLNQFADQCAWYGLTEQEQKLRAKAATAPKYTQHEIDTGVTKLWEQQAKQGFW
jgi:hypothetical protein